MVPESRDETSPSSTCGDTGLAAGRCFLRHIFAPKPSNRTRRNDSLDDEDDDGQKREVEGDK